MKLSMVSLCAAVVMSGLFVGQATQADETAQCPAKCAAMGPESARPLFGENLEEGDFPEGVWYFNDQKELCANKDAVIWTKQKYSAFVCSFEFNLSEHTNGGFLIQSSDKENWIPNTIEIQLLDDFGNTPDYHSCGSFYGFQAPTKNVTKKPGEWNKMVVIGKGRKITVILNGEKINEIDTAEWTDAKKSPAGTDIEGKFQGRSLSTFEPYGYIGFQGLHGNSPMRIRNAVISPIKNADTTKEGWKSLFGDKLEDAEYDSSVWTLNDDGVLSANKDSVIWAKGKYENFVLDLEFKTTEKANSGIIIQATEKENWIPNSFEVQVFDSFGRDVDMSDCGAIYGRCAPEFNVIKAPGEWNHMTVASINNVVAVVLNDQLITYWDKSKWTKADENPDGSKPYPWLINKAPCETENAGFIGIQGLHGNEPVVYRNIKIHTL